MKMIIKLDIYLLYILNNNLNVNESISLVSEIENAKAVISATGSTQSQINEAAEYLYNQMLLSLEREEEDNPKTQKRLQNIRNQLSEMRQEFQDMKLKWENEKKNIEKIQKLKTKIDEVNAQIENLTLILQIIYYLL